MPFQKNRDRNPPLTKQASSLSLTRTFVPLDANMPRHCLTTEDFFRGSHARYHRCQKFLPQKFIIDRITDHCRLSDPRIPLHPGTFLGRILINYFPGFAPINGFKILAGSATAMMIAVAASNASISLKSLFSKPFTTNHFQVLPPSMLFLPAIIAASPNHLLAYYTEAANRNSVTTGEDFQFLWMPRYRNEKQ